MGWNLLIWYQYSLANDQQVYLSITNTGRGLWKTTILWKFFSWMCFVGSLSCLPNSPVHNKIIIRCCTIQWAQQAARLCRLQATTTLNTSNSGLCFACSSVLFHRFHYLTTYWTCSSLAVISNSAFIFSVPFSFLLLHGYICFVLLGLSVQRNLLRVLNFISMSHVSFVLFIWICFPALYCNTILQLPSCSIFTSSASF
jgi:hypothetical protein